MHVTFAFGSWEGDAVIVAVCGSGIHSKPVRVSIIMCPMSHVSVTPTPQPPFTSVVRLDVFPSFFLSYGPSFHLKFSPKAARSKLGEVLRCDARSRQGLPVPGNRTDQDLPTLFCRLGPKLSPRCEAVEVSNCLLPVTCMSRRA